MKQRNRLATAMVLLLGSAVAVGAEPESRRLGRSVTQTKNEVARVVIGYKYASSQLDKPWIFLDTRISAEGNTPIRVAREDVTLVLPDGRRINLPSQRSLGEEVKDLRWTLKKADISRDPLDGYFPGRTRWERIGFFAVPGEQIVLDEFTASRDTLAGGDLFFRSPTGRWEPGKYSLEIRNKWVEIAVPFALPASPLDEVKGDPKSVPW